MTKNCKQRGENWISSHSIFGPRFDEAVDTIMTPMSTFLILLLCAWPTFANIFADKFFCGSERHPSESRILILTASDKYLSPMLLTNLTGKSVPLLELPQVFSSLDILEVTHQLQKKCFDKTILFVDATQKVDTGESEDVLVSHIQLLDLAYGAKWQKTLGMLVLVSNLPTPRVTRLTELYVKRIFKKVSESYQVLPKILLMTETEPRKVLVDFLSHIPAMSEVGQGCHGSSCLANPNGFYHGGIPWIGHPINIDVSQDTTKVTINCYSTEPSLALTLKKDNLIRGVQEADQLMVVNDLSIATFTIDNPMDKLGRYYCANSKGVESMNFLQVNYSPQTWTAWTPWTTCENVARDKVTRSRDKNGVTQRQTRFCRCSDLAELPRPRILLLGRTGVGKSTLGNQLFGDKLTFAVGHKSTSKTESIYWASDHYLGTGQCVTIIDTPGTKDTEGRDYKHSLEMQKILRNHIKSIDVFLLLFSGASTRFDESTVELLLWYEAIFGAEMWKHVVTETTFWSHSQLAADQRWQERGQLDEVKRQDLWDSKFHAPPLNVDPSIRIPTMFIDPVLDVFVDPCEPSNRSPSQREVEKFHEWTQRFQAVFMSLPPFNCEERCKAPDAFFSGSPWLSYPENGTLFIKHASNQPHHLEWQIWNGLRNESKLTNFATKLNSIVIHPSSEETTAYQGLALRVAKKWLSDKILNVRLFVKASNESMEKNSTSWTLSIENEVDSSVATIKLVKDAQFGPWTSWSSCSKSCIGLDEKYGIKSRQRICIEGFNGGLKCSDLANSKSEIQICAGENENQPKICPVSYTWSLWTPWSNCSASCGHSVKQRTRTCIDGQYGGPKCPESHQTMQQSCNSEECPINCILGQWQPWSQCSDNCVNLGRNNVTSFPRRFRSRPIIQKANKFGTPCDNLKSEEVEPCNMLPCGVNGKWREWSEFSPCSVTCGGNGTKTRSRTCNGPFYGGQPCSGPDKETEACSAKIECDCDHQWSQWSSCSKACGLGGTQRRALKPCSGATTTDAIAEQVVPCFEKMCSDEFFKLDFMEVELSSSLHAGSDNSWRIRLWEDDRQLCITDWLDRHGVNDWERGSRTQWRHKMDLPSDAFFGSCIELQVARDALPQNLSAEILGYYNRDDIQVEKLLVSFHSPTWISQPIQYEAKHVGWSKTNMISYIDGGVHVIAPLTLLHQERHCCQKIQIFIPNGSARQKHAEGIYRLVDETRSTNFWAFKHETEKLEVFKRDDGNWYFGKSHKSRNPRQIYLVNVDQGKKACVHLLDPSSWTLAKDGSSSISVAITCFMGEE